MFMQNNMGKSLCFNMKKKLDTELYIQCAYRSTENYLQENYTLNLIVFFSVEDCRYLFFFVLFSGLVINVILLLSSTS